jgi:hypothetical protein
VDGLGSESADADLVQRFLHDAVESFPGKAGEVDGHVLGFEGALDVGS